MCGFAYVGVYVRLTKIATVDGRRVSCFGQVDLALTLLRSISAPYPPPLPPLSGVHVVRLQGSVRSRCPSQNLVLFLPLFVAHAWLVLLLPALASCDERADTAW